jgi:hypothetical protein
VGSRGVPRSSQSVMVIQKVLLPILIFSVSIPQIQRIHYFTRIHLYQQESTVMAQFTSQKRIVTPNTTRETALNPKIVVTPLQFRVQSVSEKSALFREKAT